MVTAEDAQGHHPFRCVFAAVLPVLLETRVIKLFAVLQSVLRTAEAVQAASLKEPGRGLEDRRT